MAVSPSFIGTPRIGLATVATANTALDGTGTITALISGVDAGTRILQIDAQCSATSAAALINIFITENSGSSWRLFDQISITAATVGNTVKANRASATYANLVLPSSAHRLGVTTTISQSTQVIALGGDL